jgi:predicted MFS family arabinose efflux permease
MVREIVRVVLWIVATVLLVLCFVQKSEIYAIFALIVLFALTFVRRKNEQVERKPPGR